MNISEFKRGLKKGIPIALGYVSVSFTFGVKAANGGLPWWIAVLISASNVTSAGQFAGTNLILAGGNYLEIAITTLIINARYMLMSFSLSQNLNQKISAWKRWIIGFGITDEIFAVASMEQKTIQGSFMIGLIATPFAGWTLGTALGALASGIMPSFLSSAMELGLYAMFIAIIIPPAKKSKQVLAVIGMAVVLECILYYCPIFTVISAGFQVIIATVIAASLGAVLFPVGGSE